jgi:uncharacterized protein
MTSQEEKLMSLVRQNVFVMQVIDKIPELNLPNCYVAGACIAQIVWNTAHHKEAHADIKDIDLVYFDTDLSEEKELGEQNRVRAIFKDSLIHIDLINEARVHLWYKNSFGYDIKPYTSTEEAITTFPITAGVLGIRKDAHDYHLFAPLGFDDIFNLVVRANKKQITKDIYESKLKRWQPCWPTLNYLSWELS